MMRIIMLSISGVVISFIFTFMLSPTYANPLMIFFSLPFIVMTALYYTASPRDALWWAILTGTAIDIFRIPQTPYLLVGLTLAWTALHAGTRCSAAFPRHARLAACVGGASIAYAACVLIAVLLQGLSRSFFDGWRAVVFSIILHVGIGMAVLVWLPSDKSRYARHAAHTPWL